MDEPKKPRTGNAGSFQKGKRPVGRPTNYRAEYCQRALDFLSQGYSIEALAGHLDTHKQVVYEWRDKHPEFGDAIKRGVAKSQERWETLGMEGLMTNEKQKFNATVWLFNMKNRFGWRDQQHLDHSGKLSMTYEKLLDESRKEE